MMGVKKFIVSFFMFFANITAMLIILLFIIPFAISAIPALFLSNESAYRWIENMYDKCVLNVIKKIFYIH